jgi:lysophospholipase L1-like esterase
MTLRPIRVASSLLRSTSLAAIGLAVARSFLAMPAPTALLLACVATVFTTSAAHAQSAQTGQPTQPAAAAPSPFKVWQQTLDDFAAADLKRRPDRNGVLFVGSSTIRLWRNLSEDFRQQPVVINRGFGGSTLADCNHFVKQLVLQYRPAHVLVYAGDNDLAAGRTPAQVLDTFEHLSRAVRAELPNTRIAYISIKPSPLREALMPAMRETNGLIAAYLKTLPNSDYIDTHSAMLDTTGRPRAELFEADRLHMNAKGYALWQSVIAPHLPVPSMQAQAAVNP